MDGATTLFAEWTHYLLLWIGFGTMVGLLTKGVLPGKDPGGAFATLIIGILGSVIGAGIVLLITGQRVAPISVVGFVVALGGTALLLFSYRLLNGNVLMGLPRWGLKHARRRVSVIEEK